jgi:hypothetical protein
VTSSDRAAGSTNRLAVSPAPISACIRKRMRRIETTIAGIAIPDSALGREATEFVREASTPLLFHVSRRVFPWASLQAERRLPAGG